MTHPEFNAKNINESDEVVLERSVCIGGLGV